MHFAIFPDKLTHIKIILGQNHLNGAGVGSSHRLSPPFTIPGFYCLLKAKYTYPHLAIQHFPLFLALSKNCPTLEKKITPCSPLKRLLSVSIPDISNLKGRLRPSHSSLLLPDHFFLLFSEIPHLLRKAWCWVPSSQTARSTSLLSSSLYVD